MIAQRHNNATPTLPGAGGGGEGERRKRAAHALLEARHDPIVTQARRALLKVLLMTGTATADDVRGAVELPPGTNPKCFGAVPGPLARAGIIRRAGYAQTTRTAGHARPVTVWELADRTAAMQWLAQHPAPPHLEAPYPPGERHPPEGLFGGLAHKNTGGATPASNEKRIPNAPA